MTCQPSQKAVGHGADRPQPVRYASFVSVLADRHVGGAGDTGKMHCSLASARAWLGFDSTTPLPVSSVKLLTPCVLNSSTLPRYSGPFQAGRGATPSSEHQNDRHGHRRRICALSSGSTSSTVRPVARQGCGPSGPLSCCPVSKTSAADGRKKRDVSPTGNSLPECTGAGIYDYRRAR